MVLKVKGVASPRPNCQAARPNRFGFGGALSTALDGVSFPTLSGTSLMASVGFCASVNKGAPVSMQKRKVTTRVDNIFNRIGIYGVRLKCDDKK